ncbi:PREDICTED: piggyBac transposable element-derived protein 4-like isoform X2 [Dinoponera quadriceps]|uniref:PiggyBac transposable element-derived protein 4-like isoform X2 n=1 Tax=Dinoponera quadriceps TaxID=609295 RepID=A0A6P3XMP9_DINQU|nr:PREDICTED: piggyBac transposable element-derived protein 4-like isoform X2 [Dinoponera quadriceps]
MDSDKTINNITEIFADSLSDISSDDENMNICEDDDDFQDTTEVMIPVKKRERVLRKMDSDRDSENNCNSDGDESADSEIVIRARRKVLISSDSESEINDHLRNSLSDRVIPVNLDSNNWSTEDFQPSLEDFEGDWGIAVPPPKPDSIPEVVKLILGDDLFEMFSYQSSVYYSQTSKKQRKLIKSLKWSPVSPTEFKTFLALIILMGRTQKGNWKEYWSTDPLLTVPVFPQTMSRNRFEQIWKFWHFNDNSKMDQSSSRLFKIQPVLEYLVQKFNTVYKPKQQLSLDEGVIPWRGRFVFRTYNRGKIVKYGLLVRILSESDTGYICNFEIYTAEKKKLNETILSVLDPYLDLWHHVYQDNYYNSTSIAKTLLEHKTRMCGTIRQNRGLPQCLKDEACGLKKEQGRNLGILEKK